MPIVAVAIPLSVLAVALLAVIVTFGELLLANVIATGLVSIVSNLPGWPDSWSRWITEHVTDFVGGIESTLSGWLTSATQPLTDALDGIATNVRAASLYAAQYRNVVTLSLKAIVNTVMTGAQTFSSDLVVQNFDRLQQWTLQLVDDAQTGIVNWTTAGLAQLGQWAEGQITNVRNYATYLEHTFTTDVSALWSGISSAESRAAAYAVKLQGEAEQYTYDAVSGAEKALDNEIQDAYSKLASTIVAAEDWAGQRIQEVDDKYANTTNLLATLIIQQAIPRILTLEQDFAKCVTPMCDAGPGFFQDLQALLSIVEDGALIALIVNALRNPEAAAREAVSVMDGVKTLADAVLEPVFGIRA